jgi:hypothetical protein
MCFLRQLPAGVLTALSSRKVREGHSAAEPQPKMEERRGLVIG